MNIQSNTFVCALPAETRAAIKKDIYKALLVEPHEYNLIQDYLQDALDSRLCDLSDTIDINKYLKGGC